MEKNDTRKLVLKILNEKNKKSRDLLFGFYKPKLSKEQIQFIDAKLYNKHPQLLIDFQKEMGGVIHKET